MDKPLAGGGKSRIAGCSSGFEQAAEKIVEGARSTPRALKRGPFAMTYRTRKEAASRPLKGRLIFEELMASLKQLAEKLVAPQKAHLGR